MSLLPCITQANPTTALYGSASSDGSNVSTLTVSTLTARNISTFGLNADQFVKSKTFLTSSIAFLSGVAAGTSTLLFETKDAGLWTTQCYYGDPSGTNSYSDASIDLVSTKDTGINTYARVANFITTNANPITTGITTVNPSIGSPNPVAFYFVNNTGQTVVPFTAVAHQIG